MVRPATCPHSSFPLTGIFCNICKTLILSALHLCHSAVLLLTCMVMNPLFFRSPLSQPPDANVHYVRTLRENEAALPKVLHAEGHPRGVPLHEGPGPLQHQ